MLPLALLLLSTAHASSFIERPFPDTVRDTPAIVRGIIGKSDTEWATMPDGSKHLFTYYNLDVSEEFKGGPPAGSSIRIREIGGSKDGVTLHVFGTADFEKGEDVVVLLSPPTAVDNAYPVFGMMMAKFNIERGDDGKEYLRGAGIGSTVQPALRHEKGHSLQVSLDALRDIIKTQASAPKVSPKPTGGATLLTGSAVSPLKKVEFHENSPKSIESKSNSPMRPLVLILGALLGFGGWFLKSRKKKR